MAQLEGQIRQTHGMIYTGLDVTWKVSERCIEFFKHANKKKNPLPLASKALQTALVDF